MKINAIKTRKGEIVPFDKSRIERAIEKASEALKIIDLSFVDDITSKVVEKLKKYLVTSE